MSTNAETIANAISTFEEMLFNKFDRLHSHNIHDDEVIRFLRAEGLTVLAARYIEWSGAVDPDGEDDNTTMSPVVPDPGNATSYEALTEDSIDNGTFRGERSHSGEQWHIYKRRNKDDNGAYIGTYQSRRDVVRILAALEVGQA